MILGVGNDVQDALVRQTIGIQPYLSLPRINDVPVQWVQLLNGFDQQDLYGWPLPTPLKVQMQKCDKCSREFCSTINYRRHIRVHRRSNVDKESHKNRDSLGAFWDKVSVDEAKKILSFEDVTLEGVPGSSIIKALASFVRAPGFCALPQVYVKAGYVLLDVIEASPSRLPISSPEFFTVLDDASESTFLCGGSAGSLQKFIFDGEAGKVGLEMKNLVACTSFLVEQNLLKAWIADKDAEALRCQKLLVEEEEAAQKRQAELLERKRQRKLRQKEQKTKGRSNKETTILTSVADVVEAVENVPESTCPSQSDIVENVLESNVLESTCPSQSAGELALEDHNSSIFEAVHAFKNEIKEHINIEGGYNNELLDIERAKNVELPGNEDNNLDLKVAQVISNEIDTRKGTVENSRECGKAMLHEEKISQPDRKSCELMIGSISVTVGKCAAQKRQDDSRQDGSKQKRQDDSKQNDFIQPSKLAFSSHSARTFLSQRWKEAISGDHETLVLSQEPERQGQCVATNDDSAERSILGSAENRLGTMETLVYSTDKPVNAKPSRKPKKGYLIKVKC